MKRDTVRTLRTQAQLFRQMRNPAQGDILDRAAEEMEGLRAELAALRLVRAENEAGRINEEWWGSMVADRERLKAEVAALKAAAGPVAKWWAHKSDFVKSHGGGFACIHKSSSPDKNIAPEQLDELARLCGEE